jgi:hypothetical protein
MPLLRIQLTKEGSCMSNEVERCARCQLCFAGNMLAVASLVTLITFAIVGFFPKE